MPKSVNRPVIHNWRGTKRTKTRAMLTQGNRTKPCKFLCVKPVGNFIGRYSDRRRKLAFSTTTLSSDTTSAANPDEYRHT